MTVRSLFCSSMVSRLGLPSSKRVILSSLPLFAGGDYPQGNGIAATVGPEFHPGRESGDRPVKK